LLEDAKNYLFINTCGWVDGLGKDILRKIFDKSGAQLLVSMNKSHIKSTTNEFINEINDHQRLNALGNNRLDVTVLQVFNDQYETLNVKGAVNRTRKLLKSLTASSKIDSFS
jgi:hypothetical protein